MIGKLPAKPQHSPCLKEPLTDPTTVFLCFISKPNLIMCVKEVLDGIEAVLAVVSSVLEWWGGRLSGHGFRLM